METVRIRTIAVALAFALVLAGLGVSHAQPAEDDRFAAAGGHPDRIGPPPVDILELERIAGQLEAQGLNEIAERIRESIPEPEDIAPPSPNRFVPGAALSGEDFPPGLRQRRLGQRDDAPSGFPSAGTVRDIKALMAETKLSMINLERARMRLERAENRLGEALESGSMSEEELAGARATVTEAREKLAEREARVAQDFRANAARAVASVDQMIAHLDENAQAAGPYADRIRARMLEFRQNLDNLPEDDADLIRLIRERLEEVELGPLLDQGTPRRPEMAEDRVERIEREIQALRQRLQHLEYELNALGGDSPQAGQNPDRRQRDPRQGDLPNLPQRRDRR